MKLIIIASLIMVIVGIGIAYIIFSSKRPLIDSLGIACGVTVTLMVLAGAISIAAIIIYDNNLN